MNIFSILKPFKRIFPEYIAAYQAHDFKEHLYSPLQEVEFAVVDAETTGLEKSDQLITLGGVKVHHFEIQLPAVLDQHYHWEKGGEAAVIHGELPSDANSEISDDVQFQEMLNFLKNRVIVGHHIRFDIGKINQLIGEKYKGFALRNHVLDTAQLMYRLDPEKYNRSVGGRESLQLDKVCEAFGIPVENRHTALGDAFMTAQIFLFLLDRHQQRGIRMVNELLNSKYII